MTESMKLLKKCGGKFTNTTRHVICTLKGERFTLHRSGKPNSQEIYRVKKILRRLGLIP